MKKAPWFRQLGHQYCDRDIFCTISGSTWHEINQMFWYLCLLNSNHQWSQKITCKILFVQHSCLLIDPNDILLSTSILTLPYRVTPSNQNKASIDHLETFTWFYIYSRLTFFGPKIFEDKHFLCTKIFFGQIVFGTR